MGFPKKISQFPINPELKGQDLLITVNESNVTSKINLQRLRDFVIAGKDNTFVTGGTVTEDAELTLFRNDGLFLTVDLNPALSKTLNNAENIPGGEGLIFSGKTDNNLFFRSISGGDNVNIETLNNTIEISVEIPPDTNTFVTGATLTDTNNLILTRNDNAIVDVDLNSLSEDKFIDSAVLSGDTYTLFRNDGFEIPTNFSSLVSGSVTTSLFNSYTAATETDIDSKLDINDFNSYSASTETNIDSKLNINDFNTYSANTESNINSKLNINDFNSYSASTETDIDSKLDINDFNTYSASTETDIDSKLDINDFNSYSASTETNIDSKLNINDFNSYSANTESNINSKLNVNTFNSYTANTLDTFVSGGTLNGTDLILDRTDDDSVSIDLSALSGVTQNTFVTGLTYNSNVNTVTLTQNENGPTKSFVIDTFSGVTLNGNTSINGDTVVDGDVLITKNVVILGTATTINSNTLKVNDNIITLNGNATGSTAPLQIDSGIDVLRNSENPAVLLWEESNEYWSAGLSGNTDPLIIDGNNLGGGTSVFKQRNKNVLDFNTLSGGTNVTLTSVGDIVRFDVPDNTNTFVSGVTLNGNTLEIERNDGVDVPVDLTSLISGKLDISTFDSYTANTLDVYVSGGTLNGTDLILDRTDDDSVTIDLGALSGVTQNTFVTGFTYDNNNNLIIKRNDSLIDLPINLSEMSGLTVNGNLNVSGDTKIDGKLNVENITGGTLNLFTPPTINNNSEDILVRNSNTGQLEIRELTTITGDTTISSTDLVGTQYTINENNGGSFTTDFNPIVIGKLDTDLFESFTGNTINDATNLTTTGVFAQKNGNNLEFKGIQSSGGTVTITTNTNTVNIESNSTSEDTVNNATKAFNWFMTIT